MVNKSTKRRIRKNRRKVKRGIRHRIINQSINPNLSVRSNVISTNIPQNSNTSVRSKIMQNLQNPLLPIALSQTPPNVNLDAINNMRNQNDVRQQQINDTKRAKDDELARKKHLDEQERKMKKETKEAERKFEEERKQRILMEKQIAEKEKQIKKAEEEKEEANRLTETYREMSKKYAGLKNTFDLNEMKGKRDFMKAAIAEMEMNIQQQEAEINKSKIRKEIDELEAKNKMLDERKKQVQEMSRKYAGDVGLKKLVKVQHENNLKKYHTELAEKRLKVLEDNFNLKAQLEAALTKEDMDKINAAEKAKLTEAIQENIRLQQDIKDNELAHKIYNEQHDLLEKEMLNKVKLNAELDKATEINNINNKQNINEELKNDIIVNTRKKKEIEQLNMLEKSRDKFIKSYYEAEEANAAADYYLTKESIDLQNKLVETEKQTVHMLKKTEELNNLAKAEQELRKSNIAQSKAKYMIDNNDATAVAQVAYLENELSKAQNNLSQITENIQIVKNSIEEKYNMYPNEVIGEFFANNPKYQPVNVGDLNNFSLEYLQELDKDLAAYIDKYGTS